MQTIWDKLPAANAPYPGVMATELDRCRRFLQVKGLWQEYLAWVEAQDAPESKGDYCKARGVIAYDPIVEKPETIIRRMRDAW